MRRKVPHILLLATILLGASCRQEPIKTYRIAKESNPSLPSDVTAGMTAPAAPGVSWDTPDGWEARAVNSVRIGSYSIPNPAGGEPGDFSITSFPGDVGGDLANVNRWRQQIGLPAVTASDLPSLLKSVAAPAGEFVVVNFANPTSGASILAALFKDPAKTWFFKLAGPEALVASQEPAFLQLLQSVKFDEGLAPPDGAIASAGPALNTNDLPEGHPPIGGIAPDGMMPATMPAATPSGPATAAAPAGDLTIRWAAPDHWTPKDLGPMRKGSFTVHGLNGATGDMSIISLPGEAGGFHSNVNRWRGQLGLPPQDEAAIDAEVVHIDSNGLHFDVVEFASTGADAQRVLGAFLTISGETWFFKLTGADAVVAAEHDSFIQFLKTVRLR